MDVLKPGSRRVVSRAMKRRLLHSRDDDPMLMQRLPRG